MSTGEKVCLTIVGIAIAILFTLIMASDLVLADEAVKVTCPTPGQPCKVLILSPQEEDMLVKQGGILDSAAAGRYLDLGNIASYFRMKLMQATAGDIKKAEPAPSPSPAPQPADTKQ